MSMLVDTTTFDWMPAAIDAGFLLFGVLSCIAWATHARTAFKDAAPMAREHLWRRAQRALGLDAEEPGDPGTPLLNF